MAASKQTYTRVLQCSSSSVGLAQARPNYSNIRTPTPPRARMGVAKRLLAFDSLCGASVRVTDCVLAFRARTGVAKRVIAFNSRYGGQTGVPQMSFNNRCRTQTAVREGLLAIDKLES